MLYLVAILGVLYALIVIFGAFTMRNRSDALVLAMLALTAFALFSYLDVLLNG